MLRSRDSAQGVGRGDSRETWQPPRGRPALFCPRPVNRTFEITLLLGNRYIPSRSQLLLSNTTPILKHRYFDLATVS